MARTHRSSSSDSMNLPRYFGKHGHADQAPTKVKKNGSGKFNWGNAYDDIDDLDATSEFSFAHSRRRSNSSSYQVSAAKAAPVGLEYENVFEEEE